MKQKLTTIAVVFAVIGIMTGYNIYLRTPPVSEEEQQAQEEAAEGIEEGRVLAEELETEAAEQGESTDTAEESPAAPYVPEYVESWPEETPDVFKLRFVTSKGDFIMEVHKDWAPRGAERLYDLARQRHFDDVRFFRVIPGFMAQFGMSGDPRVTAYWGGKKLQDDPVKQSNTRGYVSFAQTPSPNSRGTQLFINYGNNSNLDTYKQGFAPVAKVIEGMDVVDSLYGGYGDPPGETQSMIAQRGNAYLEERFPKLDYIERVELVEPAPEAPEEQ